VIFGFIAASVVDGSCVGPLAESFEQQIGQYLYNLLAKILGGRVLRFAVAIEWELAP
jgi:hypothetical protein